MSDWIPAPEIENALLLFLEFPGSTENWPGTQWLSEIGKWTFVVPYIFSDEPENAEDWELAEPEASRGFAFAAQTGADLGDRYHAAFRRIFSRATTRRAVLVDGVPGCVGREEIQLIFDRLESIDLVCEEKDTVSGRVRILGMTTLRQDIFEGLNEECFSGQIEARVRETGPRPE